MTNSEHLEILKQGVEVWNRWFEKKSQVLPNRYQVDFYGVNLSGMNLQGIYLERVNLFGAKLMSVDFCEAVLSGADLRNSDLSEARLNAAHLDAADLTGANLSKANLREADLTGADLTGTNLAGTDFTNAHLIGANLTKVQFDGASLSNVQMGFTTIADVDLQGVKGLETVKFIVPSYIDVRTLERSKGNIPTEFLRGIGISDLFIKYATSLTSQAIQYYSCFISYSSKDTDFAKRLYADLQVKGVRCWFAPEDMKIGVKIRPVIDQSIRLYDKLLLVLSEHSINSTWVEKEVETAFEEECRRNQTVLFPVRLDNTVMETDQAWAADIRRTRQIGDFSQWKDHDAYQKAFERLLRDLKAEGDI